MTILKVELRSDFELHKGQIIYCIHDNMQGVHKVNNLKKHNEEMSRVQYIKLMWTE